MADLRSYSSSEDETIEELELNVCTRKGSRNTVEEKRKMRNARKKRRRAERSCRQDEHDILSKRLQMAQEKVELVEKLRKRTEVNAAKYQGMARTYYDRYCWELHKRKEALKECRLNTLKPQTSDKGKQKLVFVHNEIDENNLVDPIVDGKRQPIYLGRGSFGIVRLQIYRGFKVAVKEYLPRTMPDDLKREASFLSRICHPLLPLLIGITSKVQLRLVMQFHGINDIKASTVHSELKTHKLIPAGSGWLILTIQILEAVRYLHSSVEILHNDIKTDNILIAERNDYSVSNSQPGCSSAFDTILTLYGSFMYQVVLIDFGKASTIKEGHRLRLSDSERHQYKMKYPTIAPEVVDGVHPFSTKSDMYAVGHVIRQIHGDRRFFNLPEKTQRYLLSMFERCLLPNYNQRPEASLLKKECESIASIATDTDV